MCCSRQCMILSRWSHMHTRKDEAETERLQAEHLGSSMHDMQQLTFSSLAATCLYEGVDTMETRP